MINAANLSIIILMSASLIVLVLDAIGNNQAKLGYVEKPHIGLVALGTLFITLLIVALEAVATKDKGSIIDNNLKIGSVFLISNTIISILLINSSSAKKSIGTIYFLILSSATIALHNLSTQNLILKFIDCIGWMVLVTTLAVISTPGGRKSEVGLKLSFSSLMLIIIFITLFGVLNHYHLSNDLTILLPTIDSEKIIIFLIILSGMAISGIPPFHSGFIDCADGGNNGVAFLLLSNSSIQGCSLLLSSQQLIKTSLFTSEKFNIVCVFLIIGFLLLWIRALDQSKIRRTVAYVATSISPLFSMSLLFGVSVLLPKLVFLGAIYIFITLSLLALFGSLAYMESINQPWQTWEDLSGLGHKNPWQTLIFLVGLSSIAGLPGTFGYFIKLSLIAPLKENILISGSIFLSIAIGSACVMRVFVFVFSKHGPASEQAMSQKPSWLLVIASFILIGLGFFPFVS